MGIDDLAMMANTPANPADVEKARDAEIGKAAAGETMPSPKDECEECEDTTAGRIARRGQDPPAHSQEHAADPDSTKRD
jgi:hypothetical protein